MAFLPRGVFVMNEFFGKYPFAKDLAKLVIQALLVLAAGYGLLGPIKQEQQTQTTRIEAQSERIEAQRAEMESQTMQLKNHTELLLNQYGVMHNQAGELRSANRLQRAALKQAQEDAKHWGIPVTATEEVMP